MNCLDLLSSRKSFRWWRDAKGPRQFLSFQKRGAHCDGSDFIGHFTPPSLSVLIHKMRHLPVLSVQWGCCEAELDHMCENTWKTEAQLK